MAEKVQPEFPSANTVLALDYAALDSGECCGEQ